MRTRLAASMAERPAEAAPDGSACLHCFYWVVVSLKAVRLRAKQKVGSVPGQGGSKAAAVSGRQPAASVGRHGVSIAHCTGRETCEAHWGGRRGLGGAACGGAVALLPASVARGSVAQR